MTAELSHGGFGHASGEVVGDRYRLEAPVGRGGMATVWRAVHLDLNRPVALKFLAITGGDPTRVRERFLREARIAAAVRHRNVVDITDFGTTRDASPFMVMELLEGESLATRMARDPSFAIPDVIRIGARALSGLGAVHDAGIIHRDLKPENVFLVRDADGTYPKLLDFGISRSLEEGLESVVPSSDNVLAGTPQYMSPEQARGVRDLDARSDLWAVGVMLYEMLTAKLPFDDENPGDLIVKILTEEPVPLDELRPDLSGPLAGVVVKALARNRVERFASAREMRQGLLNAATQTAAMLQRGGPDLSVSISDHPGLEPRELMDAVGSAYEPGDSGVLDVSVEAMLARSEAETRVDDGAVRKPLGVPAPSLRLESLETQRTQRSPSRPRGALMASAVILGLAGAVAVVLVLGSETGEGSGESGPAAFASMAETHEPSIVTLRRLPAEAAVTLDGRAHSGSAIEVPRDGAEHVIEVNAPGFEPWQVTHSGDADVAYDVVLRPLGAGGAATRPGRGAESGTRGTARPRGTGRPDELIRDPGF